ncbi:MAG: FadR family transcriptional regulator [Saprospiraceae bacterium]|nr:FadR family transcriptional regulator [Saprospiraceae bacterium]MCB0668079.1 FadR family transcriptional regulator [Saprospiraceae bacterium]MCB9320824.1 FadR family transcriptional regulator [Lewinellaceae bacterium]
MVSDSLKITDQTTTLVDKVEEKLLNYIKESNFMPGDSLPNEKELAEALGVARSVLREALSRLRMMGLIQSRTKKGMTLAEPNILNGMRRVMDPRLMSKGDLLDILNLRIIIEIGMCNSIFVNKTDREIAELEEIVNRESVLSDNLLSVEEESNFHRKLYEITKNNVIIQLHQIFNPVFTYVKEHYSEILDDYRKISGNTKRPTHKDLVGILKNGSADEFQIAMKKHLDLYFHLFDSKYRRKLNATQNSSKSASDSA